MVALLRRSQTAWLGLHLTGLYPEPRRLRGDPECPTPPTRGAHCRAPSVLPALPRSRTQFAILALVRIQPMSGYDIRFVWRRSLISVVIAHALINTLVLTLSHKDGVAHSPATRAPFPTPRPPARTRRLGAARRCRLRFSSAIP